VTIRHAVADGGGAPESKRMKGEKPYTLRDGTVITVDAGIPDAALDRLNGPPASACGSRPFGAPQLPNARRERRGRPAKLGHPPSTAAARRRC
jgi:hypothetical protein